MPDSLWTHESPTPNVDRYIDLHFGEFPTDFIKSSYPYSGKAIDAFRRCSAKDERRGFDMCPGLGEGCWVPRRDAILNGLTADLLAAAKMRLVQIAEEIIATLTADPNAEVKVRIEIEATFANGAQDQIKRAVSENAKTLGFGTAEWE